jgi:hypothetical protein
MKITIVTKRISASTLKKLEQHGLKVTVIIGGN